MRHIAQQARDIEEIGKAIEHGADPVLWGQQVQDSARTIFKLTEEERSDE